MRLCNRDIVQAAGTAAVLLLLAGRATGAELGGAAV